MKQRRLEKKAVAWLLCLIMVLTMVNLPVFATTAYAATKISKCKITLSTTSAGYTGKAIKPGVVVKNNGRKLRVSTDYTVSYKNNILPGTATVTIKGKGKYTGSVVKSFTIKNMLNVSLSKTSFTYTGKSVKPAFTVKSGTKKLAAKYYAVSYKDNINVGKAQLIVKGKGKYLNKNACKIFMITPAAITASAVALSAREYTYTGKEVKPAVTVKVGAVILRKGVDYTVTYANNVKPGTATVTVKGKGNYKGSVTKQFEIKKESENPTDIIPNNPEAKKGLDITSADLYTFEDKENGFENKVMVTVYWPENKEVTCITTVKDPTNIDNPRLNQYVSVEGNSEGVKFIGSRSFEIHANDATGDTEVYFKIGSEVFTCKVHVTKVSGMTPAVDIEDMIQCETTNSTYESILSNGSTFTYGQAASSVLSQVGLEQAKPNEFNNPNGFDYCIIDGVYYCFVVDSYNNRVLCYTSENGVVDALTGGNLKLDETTADPNDKGAEPGDAAFVLGQKTATTSTPGYGLDQLNWPMSVSVEKRNNDKYRLYVSDVENDRVLVYEDITSLTSGAAADYAIEYFNKKDGTKKKIGWPWAVKSINVNGAQKLLLTSTEGTELGIYTSPLDQDWSDDVKVDLIYGFGETTTPRTICWTGSQLLIGDENVRTETASKSGFHIFNEFPTSTETPWFGYFNETTYSEGVVINDKLYLLSDGGWDIFDKNEDGKYIENADAKADSGAHACREDNYRVNAGDEAYFVCTSGTSCVAYVKEENTIILPVLGRSAIYAWTDPTNQLTSNATAAPDIYIGDMKYKEDLRHVASDVQLHNPNVVTDGEHLVVHNDLDGLLYVYKKIPTSSGAVADYKYTLFNAAMDVELNTTNEKSTMIVTGNSNNTLLIWDDYKFDGSLPNRALRNVIGGLNFPEMGATLQYVRYDGEYSYLSVTEQGRQNVYIYEGLVDKDSSYIAKINDLGAYTYGHVSANNEYVAITAEEIAVDGKGKTGLLLLEKSKTIQPATADKPFELNVNDSKDGVYKITKVHSGVTATEENDEEDNPAYATCNYSKSEVGACYNNEILIKSWTDEKGNPQKTHEYSDFEGVFGCLLAEDGKFIVADLGHTRVIIWDSVSAAIADQSKDYKSLTVDNEHVTILGHGVNAYDKEDINGHTRYDGHVMRRSAFADCLRMPKTLAYDGHNLWVGEFKFSNRLLRFEMK